MFANYEELRAAVNERKKAILTIEVDMANTYSQEHEDAKTELKQAKAMNTLTGVQFLSDNIGALEARVAETKPEEELIFLQYRKIELDTWSALIKKTGMTPLDQYEHLLPLTFIGLFGDDPSIEREEPLVPLSTNGADVSSRGNQGILPPGAMNSVVQTFLTWQNSGGEVSIRPTMSGRD